MLNLVPSCHEKHSVGVEPFASWPSERDGAGGPSPRFRSVCSTSLCYINVCYVFFPPKIECNKHLQIQLKITV